MGHSRCTEEGRFRADLYDRLDVFRIDVPSLRERKDDIHLLASCFLKKLCVINGRHHKVERIDHCISCLRMAGAACARREYFEKLAEYSFPGNVRELRNLITRVASGLGAATANPPMSNRPCAPCSDRLPSRNSLSAGTHVHLR